jgi:hypothetical protein
MLKSKSKPAARALNGLGGDVQAVFLPQKRPQNTEKRGFDLPTTKK